MKRQQIHISTHVHICSTHVAHMYIHVAHMYIHVAHVLWTSISTCLGGEEQVGETCEDESATSEENTEQFIPPSILPAAYSAVAGTLPPSLRDVRTHVCIYIRLSIISSCPHSVIVLGTSCSKTMMCRTSRFKHM